MVTHYPQRGSSCCPVRRESHPLVVSSAIMFGEERIKNKIESNNKKIYIYRKKTKQNRNTGGKELTLVGGLTHQARPAHTRDSHLVLDCHGHTHTSTALFPFAQANTYRERLSIKGLWGEGRDGICSRQSQCQQGGGPVPSSASSLLRPAWSPGGRQLRLGCAKGLPAGRTSRTSRSWGQKTSHGGGSDNVLCILCRHLAESRASAHTRGRGLGSGRHLLMVRRALS